MLLVALILISSVAVAAIVQGREATRQRDLATSGGLAVRSDVERAIDPMLAVSLALQSIDASRTEQSELALRQSTLQARQLRTLLGHQGRILSATFSLDEQLLASGGDGGVVRLWGAQQACSSRMLSV